MPIKTDIGALNCSLARVLGLLGDAWSFLIVRDLLLGSSRFVELRESLGIARNVLTQRLVTLEAGGLIVRRGSDRRPTYHLTDRGYELVPALVHLMQWGDRWLADNGAPMILRASDGVPLDPAPALQANLQAVNPREIVVTAGPGADERTREWLGAK